MSKKINKMLIASVGVALGITSLQVSAANPDNSMPRSMCFHINPLPNLPDHPQGTYLELGFRYERQVRLDDRYPLRLVRAHGVAIGRTPIPAPTPTNPRNVEYGNWVGSPSSGTCHKHGDKFQCSLHSTASTTTELPAGSPIAWSIETVAGSASLVHDMTNNKTTMSLTGIAHAITYDETGVRIPDAVAATILGVPISKEISTIIPPSAIEKVDCKSLPHPEVPDFFVPEISQ